ncbi:MAG: dihydroflavonol-4-reductase [Oleispira sp.]|jgi:dihydroflavonol-4-reductase
MGNVCLVTGANGHLGNNLVRALLDKKWTVRAGVRNLENTQPFVGLDCELVYAELQDKEAMVNALKGVDVLFQVAAVFKHWAKDPEAEIVSANVNGTRIVLEAAAKAGVKKVVYVSSVAAIGHNGESLDESQWNTDMSNPYYRSKILSEQQAWKTAKELGLSMVSLLPSAMIGPNAHALTDTMEFIEMVRTRQIPMNPNFHFNFIDVRDVAVAAISAAIEGKEGERYIVANKKSSEFKSIIAAANFVKPGYKTPPTAPKWLLLCIAYLSESVSRITGKRASMTVSQVNLFYGVKQEYNTSKSLNALNFAPRTPEQSLKEVFSYLAKRQHDAC